MRTPEIALDIRDEELIKKLEAKSSFYHLKSRKCQNEADMIKIKHRLDTLEIGDTYEN